MCLLAGWIVAWLPADRESLTVGFVQLAADGAAGCILGPGFGDCLAARGRPLAAPYGAGLGCPGADCGEHGA